MKGCDVVLIPAGVPRKPGYTQDNDDSNYNYIIGMTRDDLFNTNATIVLKLTEAAAR